MKPINLFLIFFFCIFISGYINAQGCSDAGFCSLRNFKAQSIHDYSDSTAVNYKNEFKIGGSYGRADHNIDVLGGFLEYHRDVDSCSSIDIRLTYLSQENELVRSYGPSDLFVTSNWTLMKDLVGSLGFKLPLTVGSAEIDGNDLPMDFQHSIGTFDLIVGVAYKIKGIHFNLALQQPLNKSQNKFLAEEYPNSSPFRAYQSTNRYIRRGDLLLRISYPYAVTSKFVVTPSILPIYHLANDQYTDIDGIKQIIEGSDGLTLNANLFLDYSFSPRNKISLSGGIPLVVRDIRPDGLTRKFVAGIEFARKF